LLSDLIFVQSRGGNLPHIAARILAIDCIGTLLIASTLFLKEAHRAACVFPFGNALALFAEELPAFVFALPVFELIAVLFVALELFAPALFALLPFAVVDPVPLRALFARTCVTGASRTGAATFNTCPVFTVLTFKWFQLRSSSTDTLYRSATVTRVSPLRTV